MRPALLHRALVVLAMVVPACEKDTPTRPPTTTVGTGFVFSSIRDLYAPEIYSIRSDGSGLLRLTNDSLDDREPRWSPDGKRIAFIHAYESGGKRPNLTVIDANGSNPVRLSYDTGDANPSWSPDGSKLAFERDPNFFSRNQLWTINSDGTSPELVIDSLDVREISWTPANTFLGVDGFGIVQFGTTGASRTRILSLPVGTVSYIFPRMSPDATRIVFTWAGGAAGSQVYSVNTNGTDLQQLTNTTGAKSNPTWSADGTEIGFTSLQDGTYAIWTMDKDGSDQARVSPAPGGDFLGDWR